MTGLAFLDRRPPRLIRSIRPAMSGGLITDATRQANIEGDGRAYPDYSVGNWPTVNNFFRNGNAATNLTGWTALVSAAVARVTTQAKFGTTSVEVITPNAAAGEGVKVATNAVSYAAGRLEVASVWVKAGAGSVGGTLSAFLRAVHSDVSTADTALLPVVLTADWQQIAPATLTTAVGKTTVLLELHVVTDVQQAVTFYVGGAMQCDQVNVPQPYKHTDGALAMYTQGMITVPRLDLSVSRGWFAVLYRAEWTTGRAPVASARLATLRDDDTHRIEMDDVISTFVYALRRQDPALQASGQVTHAIAGHVKGTTYLFVGQWTPTQVMFSFDGSTFTANSQQTAASNVPIIATRVVTLVTQDATNGPLSGEMIWFAMGDGRMTDADVARLNGLRSRRPLLEMFPARPKLLWEARNAFAWVAA